MPETRKSTVMNVKDYPELEGMGVGDPVSGSWSGNIAGVDEDNFTVTYDEVTIETESGADKELRRLSGKEKKAKVPINPDVDEDY